MAKIVDIKVKGKKPFIKVLETIKKGSSLIGIANVYVYHANGMSEYRFVLPCDKKVLKKVICNLKYRTTAKCFA